MFILLLASSAGLPGLAQAAGNERPLDELEEAFQRARSDEEAARLARELVFALEEINEIDSHRYIAVVEESARMNPEDWRMLVRRARVRFAFGRQPSALADFRAALRHVPAGEAGTRRAIQHELAEACAAMDLFEEQIRIDEELVESDVERRFEIMKRLARGYSETGQLRSAREILRTMLTFGPESLRFDPDVAWMEATLSLRVDPPDTAQSNLLRFATLHARDGRALEALTEAAKIARSQANYQGALLILEGGAEMPSDDAVRAAASLERSASLQQLGRKNEAARALQGVLLESSDAASILEAMDRMFELAVEQGGIRRGLHFLVQLTTEGQGAARQAAVSRLGQVLRTGADQLVQSSADALYIVSLADRANAQAVVPVPIRLSAARVAEAIGNTDLALDYYGMIQGDLSPEGHEARLALVRLGVEDVPFVREAESLVNRGRYFESRQERDKVVETLRALQASEKGLDEASTLRLARALLHERENAQEALALLESARGPEALLLRADARALLGQDDEACAAYRSVPLDVLSEEERAWAESRRLHCDPTKAASDAAARAKRASR